MGEKSFIFDSFSCRKNKGAHLAVKRLKAFVKKVTENHRREAFYLHLDISGFFMAIEHHILYSLFKKMILRQKKSWQWKEDILWLAKTIIFHKPTQNYIIRGDTSLFRFIPSRRSLFNAPENKGLPIGNYSSQFFANLYLNEVDQFIKRGLKCRYYIRYVDDLVLLDEDREQLKYLRDKVSLFLKENLDLELNLNKTKLQSIHKGIDFLGYFIRPSYILVRQKIVKRFKKKLYGLDKTKKEIPELKKILATVNSYYGHFRHACSFNLRKSLYENHLGDLKEKFLPKKEYASL